MRRHAKAPSAASTSSTGLGAVIALAAMAMLCLAFLAAPALAFQTHDLEASFGAGVLSGPSALAVDGSGNVLVANVGSSDVRKFDSAGNPVDFSALGSNSLGPFPFEQVNQLAIDASGGVNDGNIYVAKSLTGGLEAFKPSGAPANFTASAPYISGNALTGYPGGSFSYTCGVAVDSNGTIYVGNDSAGTVIFASSGEYLTSVAGNLCNVAVDSVGTFYTTGYYGSSIRYQPSSFPVTASTTYGAGAGLEDSSRNRTIALDPADDNIYGADANGYIAQYDSAANGNAIVGKFGFGNGEPRGIAIDRSGGAHEGSVYVSSNGEVKRYGPAQTLADLTVADATAVAPQAATLNGTISAAGGPAVSCEFQYVSESDFQSSGFTGASTAPCSPAGPFTGTAVEAVSANVTGLVAGAAYRFRLHSTNANGSIDSSDLPFTTAPAVKEVLAVAATDVTTSSATLNGSINPGGVALTECKFEYGLTEALGSTVPCAESPGSIGSGEAPVSVHADLTGLSRNIYHYRLVATNSIGTTKSDEATVAIPGAPVILGQFSGSESFRAVLKATINPGNKNTTYRFEYGTTAGYGQSTEEATISAGNDPVKVAQEVKELAPATTYHYRVVVVNDVAEAKGADQTFTTDAAPGSAPCTNAAIRAEQGSITLPECRAYEQVSPVDKFGQNIFVPGSFDTPQYYPTAVAPDGSAASFQSSAAFGDGASSGLFTDYVARRGASGWSTHSVTSKYHLGFGRGGFFTLKGWSDDLSKAVVRADAFLGSEEIAALSNFYLADVSSGTDTHRGLTLDPGRGPYQDNVNELELAGGSADFSTVVFEDVAVHTDDAPEGPVNPYVWRDGQVELVSMLPDPDGPGGSLTEEPAPDGARIGGGSPAQRKNAISDDGSRIFFTTPDGRIYVRKDGASTVEVSASQKAVPDAHQPASYQLATRDGRFVFFSTEEQLLGSDANSGRDVYRYDVDSGTLTQITTNGGEQLYGVSDDGAYVYLAVGDLMVWHDGQIDTVANGKPGFSSGPSFQVTPDGTAVAFESDLAQQLSGEDPQPSQAAQVYLYDAVAETLRCVSCRRDGGAPSGPAVIPGETTTREEANFEMHSLSDDGQRVFFSSPDPLVSTDTNEKYDAYEYVNGRQYLLSSGLSPLNSFFMNATASGSDAFFSTVEPLVRRDADANIDLYVARVNGGFAEPPPQVPCTGEACKTDPTRAPQGSSAGSAQFSGPGNAGQRAQQKAKKKKQKKKARNKKKAKKRASKSKGASKRSVGK